MAVALIEVNIGQIDKILFHVDMCICCTISLEPKNTDLALKFLVCPKSFGDEK